VIEDSIKINGVFDKALGNPLYDSNEFGVMGFSDVLPLILKAKRAIKELSNLAQNYDKVLLIDAPSFNLPLAKEIKKLSPKTKIIYYILPKVWAWKPKRVKKIDKYVDIQASIFPFEKRFYKNSIYVGNPLLDELRDVNYTPKSEFVAFLPGSRKSEIKALMPIFKEVKNSLNAKALLAIPPHFSSNEIEALYGDISDFEVTSSVKDALKNASFAYVCSGTATLEAALIGVPFVLVYRAKKIDFLIAKKFVKLKYAGLANIILDFEDGDFMHKELFQEEVNKKNLIKLYDETNRDDFLQKSKKLKSILKNGSSQKIVDLILN
jgi:lipid-A-disaccharide synthase